MELFVRIALLPLDRPGLTLVVALGIAAASGAIVFHGALR